MAADKKSNRNEEKTVIATEVSDSPSFVILKAV
jgi:hypothetical protein